MTAIMLGTQKNAFQRYANSSHFHWKSSQQQETTEVDMNTVLNRYYHKNVQINQQDAEKRRAIAFPNVEKIIDYVNQQDTRFGKNPIRAGSYWQGLKVDKADEFDYSITLEGIGSMAWGQAKLRRYYNFNRRMDPDHSSIPQDLDVVMTDVPLPSPPKGYLYISMKPHHLQMEWDDISDLTRQGDPGEVDIVPFLVRKRLKQLLTKAKRDLELRGDVRQSRKVNGPALTMFFKVRSTEIGVDFAPIIRVHLPFPYWICWPRSGVCWPNPDKIQEIKNYGINVVAKKDFWWMLSFAELEKKLVDKVDADGGKRKEVHRLMKKLNGDVWCNTSKPVLSSYMLKNIWFWEMEKYPDERDWDKNHIWIRLESMTRHLLQCIQQRKLEQYFYPDINLFTQISSDSNRVVELDIASDKIEEFLGDPLAYLE